METSAKENTVDLFYYIKVKSGQGYQHYTAVIGDNHSRQQIKLIENDVDFSKWTIESKKIIDQHFRDIAIRKPKTFKDGNRR